jgi:hypothetical protein
MAINVEPTRVAPVIVGVAADVRVPAAIKEVPGLAPDQSKYPVFFAVTKTLTTLLRSAETRVYVSDFAVEIGVEPRYHW